MFYPDSVSMTTASCTLHGIPNCDTVKKARAWLAAHGINATFHDFRKDGLTPAMLEPWVQAVGWETLVNRKGTTWRALPEDQRPTDAAGAIALMLASPAVIKRPVLVVGSTLRVGFDAADWAGLFA